MHPPLLNRFRESCEAANVSPTAVLKAAGIHPSLWWKWSTGKVSPTLRSFEAVLDQLTVMGGSTCSCGRDDPGAPQGEA
jgi:hypothetical protein